MSNEIIIAAIGVVSTFASGFTSWFFTRKKYNSEVNHNTIENMDDSLEFYKRLSDDNKARLDDLLIRNQELALEVQELRRQVLALTLNICMDLTCANRIRENQNIKRINGKSKDRFNQSPEHCKG
jgi:hypothetical protein